MPETLSFLEWNSVGFYLPENFSMSLVFCSVNPRACGGVCFYSGTCTSAAGTWSCVGTGRGCCKWVISPLEGGRTRGVYLIKYLTCKRAVSAKWLWLQDPPSVPVVAGWNSSVPNEFFWFFLDICSVMQVLWLTVSIWGNTRWIWNGGVVRIFPPEFAQQN